MSAAAGASTTLDGVLRSSRRRLRLLLLFAVLVVMLFLYDVMTGSARLEPMLVLKGIMEPESVSPMVRAVLWTYRLPASLTALAVGASLGLAGAVMQTLLNNPLASPYTLGVGAGASFGASLAVAANLSLAAGAAEFAVPLSAFCFAMTVCLFIYMLGRQRGMSAEAMILAGIALLFLFQALQALLQYFASEGDLQAMVFWTFGSLQKSTWTTLALESFVLALTFPLLMKDSWQYTALLLGDERARSLGVRPGSLRLKAFFLVSLLSAAAVCFTGTIGFIGLAGPHMARRLAGEDHRFSLPLSSLCGALMLSAASVISKSIIPGALFPIGVVTSLIGVPFFFAVAIGGRRGR